VTLSNRIQAANDQGRRIKRRRGAILDCGGTTPLWLHRPNDRDRESATVQLKRGHAAAVHTLAIRLTRLLWANDALPILREKEITSCTAPPVGPKHRAASGPEPGSF
jgi:hypothetical protein